MSTATDLDTKFGSRPFRKGWPAFFIRCDRPEANNWRSAVDYIPQPIEFFIPLRQLITLKNFAGMKITFNELRRIKDSLPDGSIHKIADELEVSVETVRNYFGGYNYRKGESVGVHIEEGPDGGIVELDDTRILDRARSILDQDTLAVHPN